MAQQVAKPSERIPARRERDPFMALRERMERLFDEFMGGWEWPLLREVRPFEWRMAAFVPSVDIKDEDNQLKIEVELPGVSEKDVELSISGDTLIIMTPSLSEPTVAEMTKTMLERIGYRVTASTRGSEALKVFAANPDGFDLVIADQTMPDITGIALAKEILAVDPDMPVIICTGYGETVSPESTKDAGIREFAFKPVTRKKMAQAIRRVLEQGEEAVQR